MDTDRKNQCVQVSYHVPAVNHPRELLGVAISKPLHPTATYDHSTVVDSSRHLQAGSIKKPSNEMCSSGVVHCSEQGHTVGGSHWRQHGIDLKHTQTGIDTREFSEVGSCGIPVNSACNEVSALKCLKASMGRQSVPAPKQVLVESSELSLRNESREACILNSIEVSDTSNLFYSPESSGICSKQAVVDGSLLSPALCRKMQANKPVMKAENDQNNDDSGNCAVPNPKISISNYNSPLTSFSTINQFMDTNSEEDSFVGDVVLNPKISISNCNIPLISFCTINQFTDTNSVKDSFVTAKVSDGSSSVEKISGSAKLSDLRTDINGSEKSSICRESTGSDVSDESSCTSFSNGINRPHKANDLNWEAIRAVRLRDGVLGLSHFRLLKRLGCGDIGSVYLALLCGTKSYFALKVMDKEALASRKKLPRAQTEREILQSLDHPFLPTLYTHFETDNFSCLVMEFCPGGDLHTLRQRQPGKYFPEEAARFYVAEVLLALEYLHMLGIIYRDLKPENILVRADGHIMLSDFDLSLRCVVSPTLVRSSNMGMSSSKKNAGYCVQPACIEPTCAIQPSCVQPTCFSPGFLSSTSKKEKKFKPKAEVYNQVNPLPELIAEPTSARSMSFVGTHEYLAPEIIKGEGHGSAVDWWTFGIFLYELLFGKTPFKGSGNRATLFNVVGQPLRFPEYPMVSFAARNLIRGLLVKEPQHRLAYKRGATEIKQHPFFQNVNWALIRCMSPPEVPKPVESVDFPQRTEVVEASTSEKMAGINVKPSGNYLEIDFF